MGSKIKILFYGDSPTVATGFGTVSRNILMGLHKTGKYDIQVLGVNYHGDPHQFPFPIWPIGIGGNDPYGRQRAFDMMANQLDFDVLFFFQDSFILKDLITPGLSRLRESKKFVAIGYYPVDGAPKPSWIESMSELDVPVTYTEFGKEESILACPKMDGSLQVIPHGVNTEDFYPLPSAQVLEFRQKYFGNHANKFIVTNLNRNQQRKDIPRTILAFKEFRKRRPNSVLYLHMATVDQGWDLAEVCQSMGLRIGHDVLVPGSNFGPNRGYPINIVNSIYNASDVVVSTTLGEGWGLSTVEAMACRTPVIFPRNTALTEIIGDSEERGFLVDSGKGVNQMTVLPNDKEVVRPMADALQLAEKLVLVYDSAEEVTTKTNAAYKWVTSQMVWGKDIVPQWDDLIMKAISEMVSSATGTNEVILAEDL